jgi:hypothetical protein
MGNKRTKAPMTIARTYKFGSCPHHSNGDAIAT